MALNRGLLTEVLRTAALADLPGWSYDPAADALVMKVTFPDFVQAFAFMIQVAFAAEALDHHPDWSNTYGSVRISLRTHDVGGVTPFDIELARRVNKIRGQVTPVV